MAQILNQAHELLRFHHEHMKILTILVLNNNQNTLKYQV